MTAQTRTLTDFLERRLAEDEVAAREATQGRWIYRNPYSAAGVTDGKCALCHSGPPIWSGRRDINGTVMDAHVHEFPPYDHSIVVLDGGEILTVVPDGDYYGHVGTEDAAHIARHDPARVLAEVEAKRRIVEDYRTLDADYRVTRDPVTEARRFQALVAVGQLATAYADHPEFDEAWRA